MTKEEFKKEVDKFWNWVSDRNRDKECWFLDLHEWSDLQYSKAFLDRTSKKDAE